MIPESDGYIAAVVVDHETSSDVIVGLVDGLPPGFELVLIGNVDKLRLGVWGERVDRIVTGEEGGLLTALGSITAEVSIVIDGPFHAAQISRMLEHGRRGRVGHIGAAIAGPTGTLLAAAARSDDSVKGLINQLEMSTALDVLAWIHRGFGLVGVGASTKKAS